MRRDVILEGEVVWKGSRGSLEVLSCELSEIARLKQETIVGRLVVMAVSPLDYRYGRDISKEIWSREGRHARSLEVERALIWAHSKMGRVSPEDYDAVAEISDPGIVTQTGLTS